MKCMSMTFERGRHLANGIYLFISRYALDCLAQAYGCFHTLEWVFALRLSSSP